MVQDLAQRLALTTKAVAALEGTRRFVRSVGASRKLVRKAGALLKSSMRVSCIGRDGRRRGGRPGRGGSCRLPGGTHASPCAPGVRRRSNDNREGDGTGMSTDSSTIVSARSSATSSQRAVRTTTAAPPPSPAGRAPAGESWSPPARRGWPPAFKARRGLSPDKRATGLNCRPAPPPGGRARDSGPHGCRIP